MLRDNVPLTSIVCAIETTTQRELPDSRRNACIGQTRLLRSTGQGLRHRPAVPCFVQGPVWNISWTGWIC